MKILAVTNMYPSSAHPAQGVFVQQQIKGLCAAGLDVRTVIIDRQKDGPTAYYRNHRRVQLEVTEFKPDLIHVMYGGVMADQIERHHHQQPVVVTFHGSDLLGENLSGWRRKIISRYGIHCSRRAAGRAEGVIVVARHLIPALRGVVQPHRIRVIPCGIDLDRFKPGQSLASKRQLGWDPQTFHVVFASSNGDPVKRPWLARTAVDLMNGSYGPARLHYLTAVPNSEVPTWLNAGDAVLLTSLHEGSPTIVKEALACGTPVVSVDVGDVAERIEGINGCHLARPDATELAASLERVRQRGTRLERHPKLAELSLANVAARLKEFYEETRQIHEPCQPDGTNQARSIAAT